MIQIKSLYGAAPAKFRHESDEMTNQNSIRRRVDTQEKRHGIEVHVCSDIEG